MSHVIERAVSERNFSLTRMLQASLERQQAEERNLLAEAGKTTNPARKFTLQARAKLSRMHTSNVKEIIQRRSK